ncbi:hypothetical protein PPERSA_11544 [Pseudocohnilembus persalinus]|uniref:Uncharacterized protein n=1 Tax=Pseudocohnilembus persalinus TaxID=266149 RepID=A0A0V0QWY2_PSEPJ|nr:hypothetical protein PPERSA_11544 [Pseudocohnilembus persalinus]|eukprot:KRX06899.1 hypothetical protein PPERSA_11544 [Pseudocohnilembus persalinus]
MDLQKNKSNTAQLKLPGGLVFQPITDDLAEKCAEVAARAYSSMNPLAIAIGKTYEEEKARLYNNIKNHQKCPFSHVLLDGEEIVAVNFSSKFSECYLGKVANDEIDIEAPEYTEKQKFVMRIYKQIFNKEEFGDYDYLFQIYAKNPDYKKKTDCLVQYTQIFHYMCCYFGGVEELSFCTNKKMLQFLTKRLEAKTWAQVEDPQKLVFEGKNCFEGVEHATLAIITFGMISQPLPEYENIRDDVIQYCEDLNMEPNYKLKPENKKQADLYMEKYVEQKQKNIEKQIEEQAKELEQVQIQDQQDQQVELTA